jgi:hypothetical protein
MTTGNATIKARIEAAKIVKVGLTRDAKHNYYLDGQGPIPSVTGILKIVDKSGPLVGWAKRITAEAAVDHRSEVDGWVDLFGRDGAISALTKAADNIRDKAATQGSDIHALAEAITLGHEVTVTEEQAPFVDAYRQWRADFAPTFLAAEEMVCSVQHGYAGTLDAIVEIAGEVWLLDYKTSKGVYPETALQLAAYGNADFIGRAGDPTRYAIPKVDHYAVLHLRPEGYELVPFDVTGAFEAFLSAKALLSWKTEAKAIGAPVGPALVKFQAPATKEALSA